MDRHRYWFLGLLVFAASACGPTSSPQMYRFDAQGRPAIVDQRITITWPEDQPSGLIRDVEVCNGRAYLRVSGNDRAIQVVDLAAAAPTGEIGRIGDGPGEYRIPSSLLADCAADRLYVVEAPSGVTAFTLSTGEYVRAYSQPADFQLSTASRPLLSPDRERLFLPGIWDDGSSFAALQNRSPALGLVLSLESGVSAPLFPQPPQPGCVAGISDCLRVVFDRLPGAPHPWLAAQGAGTVFGVASEDGELVRTVDARSPLFLRDGTRVRPDSPLTEIVAWGERNSSIRALYAFPDAIAVVHHNHATRNWSPGAGPVQFDVFMNIFSHEGERLVSDIRLPELPVGRDETHILVIDWGPAGRPLQTRWTCSGYPCDGTVTGSCLEPGSGLARRSGSCVARPVRNPERRERFWSDLDAPSASLVSPSSDAVGGETAAGCPGRDLGGRLHQPPLAGVRLDTRCRRELRVRRRSSGRVAAPALLLRLRPARGPHVPGQLACCSSSSGLRRPSSS